MSGELANGWEWATIDDLLATQQDGRTIHQGWSPKCESAPAPDDAWGVLKTTAIQPGEFQPQHNKELPTSKQPRPLLEVAEGDLLLTCAGPRSRCGVAALVRRSRQKLLISGKMYRLRFDREHVLPEYVEGYLLSAEAWAFIDGLKTGGNESGLNLTQTRFRTLPIPLAPRSEQERIVVAIEEHLSRLDSAEAAMLRCESRSLVLEQSVINASLRGEMRRVGDCLAEPLRNGYSAPRSEDGDTRVLTLTAVTRRSFVEANTKVAVVPRKKRDELTLRNGDIFVQRSNTPELVGTAALYRGPENWAIFPDLLIRLRADESIQPAYLELALRSSGSRAYFRGSAQGIAGSMPKISQGTIADLRIPVPATLSEQQAILESVDTQLESITRMTQELKHHKGRVGMLRNSMLSAAFSGQLVAQDPADEPASVLLERIAAERPAPKQTRKKTRA